MPLVTRATHTTATKSVTYLPKSLPRTFGSANPSVGSSDLVAPEFIDQPVVPAWVGVKQATSNPGSLAPRALRSTRILSALAWTFARFGWCMWTSTLPRRAKLGEYTDRQPARLERLRCPHGPQKRAPGNAAPIALAAMANVDLPAFVHEPAQLGLASITNRLSNIISVCQSKSLPLIRSFRLGRDTGVAP